MVFGLLGCGSGGETAESTTSTTKSESSVNKDIVVDDRVLEDTFTDESNIDWEYSYHVPKITVESEAAASINEDISYVMGNLIDEQLGYMDEGMNPNVFNISWESFYNGDILSIVMVSDTLFDEHNYFVINYDILNDKRLETEDLLDYLEYDKDFFETDVRKAAVREFDKTNASYYESYFDCWTLERRAYTASNCYFADDQFYIKDGELHGIVLLGSMAGTGTMYTDVVIENEPKTNEAAPLQSNCDFVWAELLENNDVYVSFEDTQKAMEYLDNTFAEFENIKVQGLFEKYTDIFVGSITEDYFWPVVFLLTEDGHVEYVDVYNYIYFGTLCCGNLLTGPKDIEYFETALSEYGDGSYETVVAVSSNGDRYNLGEEIYETTSSISHMYTGTGNYKYDGKVVYLDITENTDRLVISLGPEDGLIEKNYYGYFTCLGMNGDGQVFTYSVCDDNDIWYNGCFLIPSVYSDIYSYDYEYMDLVYLSGDNIFETENIMSFMRSIG